MRPIITHIQKYFKNIFIPIKTAEDDRLSTWGADGRGEFVLIVFPAVIEVLEAAAVTPVGDDSLVTPSSNNRVLGEHQGIWWAGVGAQLTLQK